MKQNQSCNVQTEKPFSAAAKLDAVPTTDNAQGVTMRDVTVESQAPRETEVADRATAVAERAYQYYQNHGETDGHDVEHWLRAESEWNAEQEAAGS